MRIIDLLSIKLSLKTFRQHFIRIFHNKFQFSYIVIMTMYNSISLRSLWLSDNLNNFHFISYTHYMIDLFVLLEICTFCLKMCLYESFMRIIHHNNRYFAIWIFSIQFLTYLFFPYYFFAITLWLWNKKYKIN